MLLNHLSIKKLDEFEVFVPFMVRFWVLLGRNMRFSICRI